MDPVDAPAAAAVAWGAVWGQTEAVTALQEAASDPAAMTHAWLITGPPGSGRSTLAYAFAAAEPDRFLVLDASRPAAELAAGIRARVAQLRSPGGAERVGAAD